MFSEEEKNTIIGITLTTSLLVLQQKPPGVVGGKTGYLVPPVCRSASLSWAWPMVAFRARKQGVGLEKQRFEAKPELFFHFMILS